MSAWLGVTGFATEGVGLGDTGVSNTGNRADFLISTADVIGSSRFVGDGGLLEVLHDGAGQRGARKEFSQSWYVEAVACVLD
jgi:hypothetical protein